MSNGFPTRVSPIVQSNESLARLLEFGPWLIARGYLKSTTQAYVRCAEHFEHWFTINRIEIIDETVMVRFVREHLPSCTCAPPCRRSRKETRAALYHYLALLREQEHIPPRQPPPLSDVEREVKAFEQYLTQTCGVALETQTYRLRYVRQFLTDRYGTGPVSPHSLEPGEIMKYVAERAARYKPGTAKVISVSIRSYLKFLVLRGIVSDRMLPAVPTIPKWRLSALPKVLSAAEVDRFCSSFNTLTPTGRRDYAMALCLAELGLRTCEVASLRLDDIDWRQGTIRISGKKSRRERILPLTCGVGTAIANYLQKDRCDGQERVLFIRHRAPAGAQVTSHTVRGAVRRACARIGILPPRAGPHTLRHTLATRMLENGVSLGEVADVLGHGTIDTTAIYTKVDLASLGRVAMPWPEVDP